MVGGAFVPRVRKKGKEKINESHFRMAFSRNGHGQPVLEKDD